MRIKIHREKFRQVLDRELYTLSAIARDVGTSQSYLSRLQSDNPQYTMSKTMARRSLDVLQHKYVFDDVFLVLH